MMLDQIVEKVKRLFPDVLVDVKEFRGETTVSLRKEAIVHVGKFLRDDKDCSFEYLSDLCGADAFTPENRFEVIYHLYSFKHKAWLRLKIFTDETDLHVPSVTTVWPGAAWPEREAHDMFGIIFDGNNDLRRMYMPEEFEYYPLRKDFPLMGIPDSLHLPRK